MTLDHENNIVTVGRLRTRCNGGARRPPPPLRPGHGKRGARDADDAKCIWRVSGAAAAAAGERARSRRGSIGARWPAPSRPAVDDLESRLHWARAHAHDPWRDDPPAAAAAYGG